MRIHQLIDDFERATRADQVSGEPGSTEQWRDALGALSKLGRELEEVFALANGPITEEWLATVGFKWHQVERQPTKHWVLWLCRAGDELAIEIARRTYSPISGDNPGWFCWLRSDSAGRYHRFIHVRHLCWRREVADLVAALTGQPWDPRNHWAGAVYPPDVARQHREDDARLDRRHQRHVPWTDGERDDTRGRPLPEHLEAHEARK